MTQYILSLNPTTDGTGTHDPSAVIFENGQLVFGAEEERFTRQKHAFNTFPGNAIRACLDHCDIGLSDVDRVVVTWEVRETAKQDLRDSLLRPGLERKLYHFLESLLTYGSAPQKIRNKLSNVADPLPEVVYRNHHRCHAASAFYPSGYENALVLTTDGRGETESTVVWKGTSRGLERIRSYDLPNSLGAFYAAITEHLGYRSNNGEGKVMGLAAYGNRDEEIEATLRERVETGVDYDVTPLTKHGADPIESLFDRPPVEVPGEYTQWEKNLAHVAQHMIEETVVDIAETYARREGLSNVALAGGVALNCKMNKRVRESELVDDIYVQPVAHDAGTSIGGGFIEGTVDEAREMTDVYLGPKYTTEEIRELLENNKLAYAEPDDIERRTAELIADGNLIGWFQGSLELGPRALGNRSILADPRHVESMDRVNEFVKHREEWRPFAPSILEEAADQYLVDACPAPYMIQTFDVVEEKKAEIPAVLHPGDETTRPQTVQESRNPRYYRLISEFRELTGVPVILNTSFNDNGEPIVNTPTEALKDFFGMGLDALALDDFLLKKPVEGSLSAGS